MNLATAFRNCSFFYRSLKMPYLCKDQSEKRTGSVRKTMDLHLLHTITGFGIILSLLCKVVIHLYLDYRLHKESISLYSILITPLVYLRPYRYDGNGPFKILVSICNSFLLLAGSSLLLNIIFGVLVLF
jgi:hypothetical protein